MDQSRALWLPQADLPRVSWERWVLLGERRQKYSELLWSRGFPGGNRWCSFLGGGCIYNTGLPSSKPVGRRQRWETGPPPPTWSPESHQTNCMPPAAAPHSHTATDAQGSKGLVQGDSAARGRSPLLADGKGLEARTPDADLEEPL